MKTIVKTKPCFHCYHPVDLDNENYVSFKAMHNMFRLFGHTQDVVAHELCAAAADREADFDQAHSDYLDEQFELAGPHYEEIDDEY
ncbi:MAG TPA: hypothetical protein VGN15_13845 [Ktedonobacteraceae bacterium]|jgi:hypothetical protein|nr:hypothetical protein [Ktedonobacteraceae bacterium]